MSTRPVNEEDRQLMAMPTIASQFPVRFNNGARWDELTGRCKHCSRGIKDSLMTGRLTRLPESVVTVSAVGVCEPCKLVSRFHYRLHDDMRITGPTDGGWATWQARPRGAVSFVRTALSRLMRLAS